MRELWLLYKTFFKIGIFTFGGGLSMLPMLERELVDILNGLMKRSLWTIMP